VVVDVKGEGERMEFGLIDFFETRERIVLSTFLTS